MDIEVIQKAKELEDQINYSRLARNFAKEAASAFFKNDYGLGVYIGCLCKDKTFRGYPALMRVKENLKETLKELED